MSQPIVYIDTSTIREGKVDELKNSINHLVDFVKAKIPQLISYEFFFNEEHTRMTVVAVHPDSGSLKYHMDTGKNEFRKFAGLIELEKIEVYGEISNSVLEQLHKKAQDLGTGSVTIHNHFDGFWRR